MPDSSPRATGRCLCGAIVYEVHAPMRDVVVCHCSMCRRQHGHAAAYAGVDAAALKLVGGDDGALAWYVSSEAAERGFCRECGSSLFYRPRRGSYLAVAAGTLDAPTGLKTIRHIYVADKGDYYEITDDLEQQP